MKNNTKKSPAVRLLSLLIAMLLLSAALSSCGGKAVMTYEGYTVSANYYTYWLSRFKANFLYYYYDIKDTAEYFDSVMGEEGQTVDEILTGIADDTIMRFLVSEYLCDSYGITLTDAVTERIDEQLETILTETADGNKTAFNKLAAQYGVSFALLRDIYMIEAKCDMLRAYYKEQYLTPKLTDEMREEYYKENYACVRHIYVSTEYALNIDDDGNYIYDADGNYTLPYTEEEKAAQQAKVTELEEKLTADNFGTLLPEYNEDPAVDEYPNGFYLSTATDYNYDVITAALTMDVGEMRRVDTGYGVYFILKLEADAGAYAKEENADFFEDFDSLVTDAQYDEIIAGYCDDIVINEEAREGISIKTVTPCTYF